MIASCSASAAAHQQHNLVAGARLLRKLGHLDDCDGAGHCSESEGTHLLTSTCVSESEGERERERERVLSLQNMLTLEVT